MVPISRGVVRDWDTMEAYWDHAFTNQLGIHTDHCNVLLTSPLFDPKVNKEKLMQSLFETFAVLGVYTCAPAVLEMYTANRENGVIVGCGAQCTYAVLMHEGLPDPRTQLRSDVAGDALDGWVASVLAKAGAGAVGEEAARKAKEQLGACAADGAGTPPLGLAAATFELPDGKKLQVSAQQRASFSAPLFDTTLVGEAGGGLAQLVGECIRLRDRDGALESTVFGQDGTSNWCAP